MGMDRTAFSIYTRQPILLSSNHPHDMPKSHCPPLRLTNVYETPTVSARTWRKHPWANPSGKAHLEIIPRRNRQDPLPADIRHQRKLMPLALGFIIPLATTTAAACLGRRRRLFIRRMPARVAFRRERGLTVEECLEGFERGEGMDRFVCR